jgi:hypothetical protein
MMKSDHQYLWGSDCLSGNKLCVQDGGLYAAFGAVTLR